MAGFACAHTSTCVGPDPLQDLWKARQRPEPLRLVSILASPTNNGPVTANGYHHTTGDELTPTAAAGPADQQPTTASQALGLTNDHAVWDLLQNTQVRMHCMMRVQPLKHYRLPIFGMGDEKEIVAGHICLLWQGRCISLCFLLLAQVSTPPV